MSQGAIFRPNTAIPPVRVGPLHLTGKESKTSNVRKYHPRWNLLASARKWSSVSSITTTANDSNESPLRRVSTAQPRSGEFHLSPNNPENDNDHDRTVPTTATNPPLNDESTSSICSPLWISDELHVGASHDEYVFWCSRPALAMFLFLGLAFLTMQPLWVFGVFAMLLMQAATVVARWIEFLVLDNEQLHECIDYIRRYFGWLGKHGKIALDDHDRTRKVAFGLWYRVALPVTAKVWVMYYRSRRTRINEYAMKENSRYHRIRTTIRQAHSEDSDEE